MRPFLIQGRATEHHEAPQGGLFSALRLLIPRNPLLGLSVPPRTRHWASRVKVRDFFASAPASSLISER